MLQECSTQVNMLYEEHQVIQTLNFNWTKSGQSLSPGNSTNSLRIDEANSDEEESRESRSMMFSSDQSPIVSIKKKNQVKWEISKR